MWNGKKTSVFLATIAFVFAFGSTGCSSGTPANDSQSSEKALIDKYQPPAKPPKIDASYDVVVIGGEPEGVAAAVSSARAGAKTLFVEQRDGLGGLLTFGMLNYLDIKHGSDGKSINRGTFAEWHKLVGGQSAFDIELGKAAFYKLAADEPKLTLALKTEVVSPVMNADGTSVTAVKLRNKNGDFTVAGKRFIDATQNADFAAMSGVPYFIGGEDIFDKDRLMSVTPVIHLRGVDWKKLKQASSKEWKFGKKVVYTSTTAEGFEKLIDMYKPEAPNTRLRGLNLARVADTDGNYNYYINALQIFGVNGLDPEQLKKALEVGKKESDNVAAYLRKEMPGFEKAKIASYPTELYVRETRHIKALYQLTMADVWRNRDQWDSIGYGGYSVDIQATSLGFRGAVVGNPKQYAIPLRSLITQKITNMLVVGRTAGYSSIAAGSARVVPTGMTTGDGAGVAAALSVKSGMNLHAYSADKPQIEKLRTTLAKQGALLAHFNIRYPYEGEWFDNDVTFLINYGLINGSYKNELYVNDPLPVLHMGNVIFSGFKRINPDVLKKENGVLISTLSFETDKTKMLTRDELARYLVITFADPAQRDGPADWDTALKLQLIDKAIHDRVPDDRVLTRAEGYAIAARLLSKYVLKP